MDIRIIHSRISNDELRAYLGHPFPEMVKFVVDLNLQLIGLGGELHADAEELMLEACSALVDLWGGNLYPDAPLDDRIEYTALINIRPSQDNRSMLVQDITIRERMRRIVEQLVDL